MNRYPPSTFRPVVALASAAMTALTIGLMVVVPAELNLGDPGGPTVTARADDTLARAGATGACETGPEMDAVLGVPQQRV